MATCIIYAARTGVVRRIITDVPAPNFYQHVGPGEAYIQWNEADVADGTYPSADEASAFIAAQIGLTNSPSARCVAIDDGLAVVAVLMADPLIDVHDGLLLVQDDSAEIGNVLQADGSFE
jgi:hypothetical protein